MECWRNNKRADKFQEELDVYIDKQASLKSLKDGRLGYNDECIILAAQDQALMTNGFKKSQDDQCRFCHEAVESRNYLLTAITQSDIT